MLTTLAATMLQKAKPFKANAMVTAALTTEPITWAAV